MKTNIDELQYTNEIDKKALIEYLIFRDGLQDSIFAISMLEKVIDYGTEHFTKSKNKLYYYLMDVIPELDLWESAAFISDDLLTTETWIYKFKFWDSFSERQLQIMYDKLTPDNKKLFEAKYYELLAEQEAQETQEA